MNWARIVINRCVGSPGKRKLGEDLDEVLHTQIDFAMEENLRRRGGIWKRKGTALRPADDISTAKAGSSSDLRFWQREGCYRKGRRVSMRALRGWECGVLPESRPKSDLGVKAGLMISRRAVITSSGSSLGEEAGNCPQCTPAAHPLCLSPDDIWAKRLTIISQWGDDCQSI